MKSMALAPRSAGRWGTPLGSRYPAQRERRERDGRRSQRVVSRRRVRRAARDGRGGFRAHVERNGVDLARSRRWTVDGALSGMVLLAFRGERAWIGGFGVVPEHRGRKGSRSAISTRRLRSRATRARRASSSRCSCATRPRSGSTSARVSAGSTSSSCGRASRCARRRGRRRAGAARVRRGGDRGARAHARVVLAARAGERRRGRAVRGGVRRRAGVADAFAFVRAAASARALVDARAHDPAAAAALLAALDARFPADALALVNEPARGALHDAFTAHGGWRELTRQHRMRLALR